MTNDNSILCSIVAPIYKEEENIHLLTDALKNEFKSLLSKLARF